MLSQLQEAAFKMIANAGSGRSLMMEAMNLARENRIEAARVKLQEGHEALKEAHKEHFEFIAKEANGEELPFSILFMHAEDQLMTTELLKVMCEEIIIMYEVVHNI